MSDNDLEVKFGADATEVAPAVDQVKGNVEDLQATLAALSAAMEAQTAVIVAGFAEMAAASKATQAEIAADSAEEEASILSVAASVREGVESLNAMKESVFGFGELILAAFAVREIAEFVEHMGEAGEQVEHTAQAFGMTVGEVERLQAVFTAAGAGPEALNTAMARLDRSASAAVSGTQKTADAFKMIGVDLTVARTPAELMSATLEGFGKVSGPERAAVAMAIFGRNIQTIAPLLGMTQEKFDAYNASADRFGAVMPEASEKAALLGEALNENRVAMLGVQNVLADALAPAFTGIVTDIDDFIARCIKSYESGGLVREILDTLATSIQALQALFGEIGAIVDTFFGIMSAGAKTSHDDWGQLRQMILDVAKALVAIGVIVQEVTLFFRQLGNDLDYVNIQSQRAGASIHDFFTGDNNSGALTGKLDGVNKSLAETAQAMRDVDTNAKVMWDRIMAPAKAPAGGEKPVASTPPKLGGEKKPKADKSQMPSLEEGLSDQEASASQNGALITDQYQIQVDYWQKVLAGTDLSAADRLSVEKKLNEAVIALNKEKTESAVEGEKASAADQAALVNSALQIQKSAIAEEIKAVEEKVKSKQVSEASGNAQVKALINQQLRDEETAAAQILRIRINLDDAVMAHYAASTAEYAKLAADKAKAEQAAADAGWRAVSEADEKKKAEDAATNARLVDGARKTYTQIGDFARTNFESMIESGQTWAQTWTKLWEGALNMALTALEKTLVNHIATQTAMSGSTAAGVATRTATEQAGAQQSLLLSLETALKQITANAAAAASAAYNAMAGIPIVGPALGAAAAAVTFVAVEAYGALASASGGYDIGSENPLTQLHAQEMVLPASIANPLRGMIAANQNAPAAANSGGSGGGDTYNMGFNSLDSRGVRRMMNNPGTVKAAAAAARKHG